MGPRPLLARYCWTGGFTGWLGRGPPSACRMRDVTPARAIVEPPGIDMGDMSATTGRRCCPQRRRDLLIVVGGPIQSVGVGPVRIIISRRCTTRKRGEIFAGLPGTPAGPDDAAHVVLAD